jgi:hypothetical protein
MVARICSLPGVIVKGTCSQQQAHRVHMHTSWVCLQGHECGWLSTECIAFSDGHTISHIRVTQVIVQAPLKVRYPPWL